jgi:hypothetical protein
MMPETLVELMYDIASASLYAVHKISLTTAPKSAMFSFLAYFAYVEK